MHTRGEVVQPEIVTHTSAPVVAPPPRRREQPLDAPHNLPVQLTSFIGRRAELEEVAGLVARARLLTLTGSGGCGKTRLAIQVGMGMLADHPGGCWFVDLAPLVDSAGLALAVARALRLPDEPTRPPLETVVRRLGGERVLLILDNCEHLVEACAHAAEFLLRSCPALTLLATSRERLGAAGEVSWRVPSLALPSPADAAEAVGEADAVQLFAERARRVRSSFVVEETNAHLVAEICRRLDGIPLAIELAAARLRVLPLDRIARGLEDRLQLLTGGARTAVPRQQTLRASVEWSHELLTEPERTLFRRLGVFAGTFELDAAALVCAGDGLGAHQVLDQLTLLIDKSLVMPIEVDGGDARYRQLEIVREYALERLGDAGELEALRLRHRDHYLRLALEAEAHLELATEQLWFDRLAAELDNLRAAMRFSRERGDAEKALRLASATFVYWWLAPRWSEGAAWLDAALEGAQGVDPGVRARALAARAYFSSFDIDRKAVLGGEAVDLARSTGDRRLLGRALLAAGRPGMMQPYGQTAPLLAEAVAVARETGDTWVLMDALIHLGVSSAIVGRPEALALLKEGCELAERTGARLSYRANSTLLCWAEVMTLSQISGPRARLLAVLEEARAAGDRRSCMPSLGGLSLVSLFAGDLDAAEACARECLELAEELGLEPFVSLAHHTLGVCRLARGDAAGARTAFAAGRSSTGWPLFSDGYRHHWAEAELLAGDVSAARRTVDEAIARHTETGAVPLLGLAQLSSARIAVAQGDSERAETLVHAALEALWSVGTVGGVCDALELLAVLEGQAGQAGKAVRLHAAAHALRGELGWARFPVHEAAVRSSLAAVRVSLGDSVYETAWHEGATMDPEQAVAYARRGRGERRRPANGWTSLTPAELAVARLVSEGLGNREVAQRLFVSPRTVQTHLAHIYTKLDITTRVQLANEVARRDGPVADR